MPVIPEKVRMVAAGLRKGGFRSASAYFGAACIVHLKTYGQRPGCLVTYSIARYSRAVSRGIGPAAGKASFSIEDLVDVMQPPTPDMVATISSDSLWPCGVACLGAWWMTRSIELTAARVRDLEVNDTLMRVHWALPASKTDVQMDHFYNNLYGCWRYILSQILTNWRPTVGTYQVLRPWSTTLLT